MRRSPCPRGVASETGGAGAGPRKAFQLMKHQPQAGEAAHFSSEAENSREARGGLAISARGVSPQRRRAANAAQIYELQAASVQNSNRSLTAWRLTKPQAKPPNPNKPYNMSMRERKGRGFYRIRSLNTI